MTTRDENRQPIKEQYAPRFKVNEVLQDLIANFFFGYLRRNGGVRVLEESWDNLLLLDGARYDAVKAVVSDLDPQDCVIEHRISRGTTTKQFVRENIGNRTFSDVTYVTGKPPESEYADDFDKVVVAGPGDGWVGPETVKEAALEAERSTPETRLIVHFPQPSSGVREAFDGPYNDWSTKLKSGEVATSEVRDIYQVELDTALSHAVDLAHDLDGQSVVSSDHGLAFGDQWSPLRMRVYGNPENVRIPPLIKVPWLLFPSTRKKGIDNQTERDEIDQKLQDLGYLE